MSYKYIYKELYLQENQNTTQNINDDKFIVYKPERQCSQVSVLQDEKRRIQREINLDEPLTNIKRKRIEYKNINTEDEYANIKNFEKIRLEIKKGLEEWSPYNKIKTTYTVLEDQKKKNLVEEKYDEDILKIFGREQQLRNEMIINTSRILRSTIQTLQQESEPVIKFLRDLPRQKVEELPENIMKQISTQVPKTTGINSKTNQKLLAIEILEKKLEDAVKIGENNYVKIKSDVDKLKLQNTDPMILSLDKYRKNIDTCITILEEISKKQLYCILEESLELIQEYINKKEYKDCLSLIDQTIERFEDENLLKEINEYKKLLEYQVYVIKKIKDEKDEKILFERQALEQKKKQQAENKPCICIKKDMETKYINIELSIKTINNNKNTKLQHLRKEILLQCRKYCNRITATQSSIQRCYTNIIQLWRTWLQCDVTKLYECNSTDLAFYIFYTCIDTLLAPQDTMHSIIFAKATLIDLLSSQFTIFSDIFISILFYRCPLAIPIISKNKDIILYKQSLGYRINDDNTLEKTSIFLERLTSQLLYYFSFLYIRTKRLIQNTDTTNELQQYRKYIWVWISTIINSNVGPFTTTCIILYLNILGNIFCTLFPRQSPKILRLLLTWGRELELQPLHTIGGAEGKTSLYNLFTLLESWNTTGIIPVHPSSVLPSSQESSTQYEEITSEDHNTFS